jgi:protein-S-isoprenylcysteine O-methyltransferase Ste14
MAVPTLKKLERPPRVSVGVSQPSQAMREIGSNAAYLLLFAALLLVPGHHYASARAWTLLSVLLVLRVVSSLLVYRANPALLRERATVLHAGQPWADRVLLGTWMTGLAVLVALAGYDGLGPQRWGAPPSWLAFVGLVAFIAGWALITHVLIVNAYAVSVVRHQQERHQVVVEAGAYRVIRHPLYAGGILYTVGLCFWLQSWLAVLASVVPLAALVCRIAIEEPLLRERLPGYRAYAERVRYRILPGVW